MRTDEIERWLVELPLRNIAPDREGELLSRILAARGRRSPWWRRPIPAWQAAAACALVAAIPWIGRWNAQVAPRVDSRGAADTGLVDPESPLVIRVDLPIVARADSRRRVDLSQWEPLYRERIGGKE